MRLRVSFITLLSCFAFSATQAHAGFQEAKQAYESKNYEQAFKELKRDELKQNPDAVYLLANLYLDGLGVKEDRSRAFQLKKELADKGHVSSLYDVGNSYRYGSGVTEDCKKAVFYLEKAASAGVTEAEGSLTWMYLFGQGVPRDLAKAKSYIDKGVKRNDRHALYDMAIFHSLGDKADYALAVQYYEKAAVLGQIESMLKLAEHYTDGKGVAKNAQKAFEWAERAAMMGDTKAQELVAYYYAVGEGVTKDAKKSQEWNLKAVEKKSVMGHYNAYRDGKKLSNPEMSANYYKMAAAEGEAEGFRMLGLFYQKAIGVPKDLKLSLAMYLIADKLPQNRAKNYAEEVQLVKKALTADDIAKATKIADEWQKGQTLPGEVAGAKYHIQGNREGAQESTTTKGAH